jgi:hypothetical protein
MENLWVTKDEPFAMWVADLSAIRHEALSLLAWLLEVAKWGEEFEIYNVQEAPLAGYRRDRDGQLGNYLEHQFASTRRLDLFQFARSGMQDFRGCRFRTIARMAYFDQHGQVTESEVDDLGTLLRKQRPSDVEASAGLMSRCPPLEITGPKIAFEQPQESIWMLKENEVLVRFCIFSDIWLPWVGGFLADGFDPFKLCDNRMLAQLNTSRLNRFLATVRDTTRKCGGSWYLDQESIHGNLRFMLDDTGVFLDVAQPDSAY